jgi:glycosyltransferase involved in cell wall biosynthesis
MRILHVISGIAREQGGPTFALEGLARAQHQVGLDVTVVATWQMTEGRDNAKTFLDMGVKCHVYGPAHGKFSKFAGLNDIIAGHVKDADVVHIHAMWEEVQHVAAVEARKVGVPYIWRACNAISRPIMQKSYWLKRAVLAWRLKRDLNGAAAMHYATANERDESAWLNLKPPAVVEPNGVDPSPGAGDEGRFRSSWPQLRGDRVLLFVGRLSNEKGLDLLIPAFARARARAKEQWSLVLVGSDPERPYRPTVEAMIRSCDLAGHVLLTGHLEGQAKADAYVAADLFVLPSRSENFGNVVLEALAAGVPTVVTRGIGLAKDVESMGVGAIAEYSVDSLASVLGEWMTDDARRERLSEHCRASVADRFAWNAIAERWRDHYSRLSEEMNH